MTGPDAVHDVVPLASGSELKSLSREVELRAYEKWASRSHCSDHQLLDWLEAEAELAVVVDLAERLTRAQETLMPLFAERQEAQRRLIAEHAVSSILAVAGTLSEAAPRLVQSIGECFGWDVGCVWMRDCDVEVLRCVQVWHRPEFAIPSFEADARVRTFARGTGLPGRVWATGETVWMGDLAEEVDFTRTHVADIEGLRGAIGFPIRNGTEFLGVLEFFSREVRQPDRQMTEMMVCIGRQISQFVERREAERRLHIQEHDRSIGREIQQGLLPHTAPRLPGFEISGRSIAPNTVGGDCFDFIPLPKEDPGCIGIVVADACGHGIGAALLAAQTHAYLRGLSLTGTDVASLFRLTNECLCENQSGQFVTAILMRLDSHKSCLTYTSAGHLSGYVLDGRGKTRATLHSTGFPLGLISAATFPAVEVPLRPGDLVLLTTDGVTEAASPDGELFGIRRSLDLVRRHRQEPPDDILAELFNAVDEYCNHRFCDDITAVIVKALASHPAEH